MNDLDTILTSLVKASQEPPREESAAFEAVFDRAAPYQDPVLAWLRKEEVWAEGVYDTVEERLMERLESVAINGTDAPSHSDGAISDESIEAIIAAETVVPHGTWDQLEERLMERIASSAAPEKTVSSLTGRPRYVWALTPVLSAIAQVRPLHAVLIATVAVMAGVALLLPRSVPVALTTTLIQAWGSAFTSDLGIPLASGATVSSASGGSLSLKNAAGTVLLDGDATLTISQANDRSTEYRVFTAADRRSGRIAFSVEKRLKNQRFVVVTPWYEIHVVGTRFVVEQERGGALATTITEGKVRIVSPGVNDLHVDAGQTFSMDAAGKAWRVESAPSVPDLPTILPAGTGNGRLTIVSSPSDAVVYINDTYAGMTPYAALLPPGMVAVSVRHNGYATKDTILTLGDGKVRFDVTLDLAPEAHMALDGSAQSPGAVALKTGPKPDVSAADSAADSLAARAVERAAMIAKVRIALDSAQQSESSQWKNALNIYKRIAADLEAPPIYRQTALFSLGRLGADRFRDTSAAIKDFSEYCILYPDGVFAGEALLRLAELEVMRNPASAIDYFQRFLIAEPRHPRRADVAYHLGLQLQQRNNYGEAIRMFDIALEQLAENAMKRKAEIQQMRAAAEAARSLTKSGR